MRLGVFTYEYGDVRDGEGTVQGTHARSVSPTQERAMLGYLDTTRYPARDRVMFLVSMKAGLRAKAMAFLPWALVADATRQVGKAIQLQHRVSKGTTGGRPMPLHPDLRDALIA
jgi:integrase/recombinase XerD